AAYIPGVLLEDGSLAQGCRVPEANVEPLTIAGNLLTVRTASNALNTDPASSAMFTEHCHQFWGLPGKAILGRYRARIEPAQGRGANWICRPFVDSGRCRAVGECTGLGLGMRGPVSEPAGRCAQSKHEQTNHSDLPLGQSNGSQYSFGKNKRLGGSQTRCCSLRL